MILMCMLGFREHQPLRQLLNQVKHFCLLQCRSSPDELLADQLDKATIVGRAGHYRSRGAGHFVPGSHTTKTEQCYGNGC